MPQSSTAPRIKPLSNEVTEKPDLKIVRKVREDQLSHLLGIQAEKGKISLTFNVPDGSVEEFDVDVPEDEKGKLDFEEIRKRLTKL
jgi:hypothetical protein